MKGALPLIAVTLIMFFFSLAGQARIWRVNNNSGVEADFTTLQAAHNASVSGDSIYLEGSSASYGPMTCTKMLYVVGPGYFLDQVPNTQSLAQSAKVGSITLNSGSQGSIIMGLDFQGSPLDVFASNIVIRRNKFSSNNGTEPIWSAGRVTLQYMNNNPSTGATNIIISQNYGLSISASYPTNSVLITNNVIAVGLASGENTASPCISAGENSILLIQNNIIRNGKISVHKSNLTNNIMVAGFFDANSNLFSNNISNNAQFGAENGNKASINMTTVFNYTGSWDQFYLLKPGSPASGAGYGSTSSLPIDAGIFGGTTPYVIAGQVNMPAIYYFSNQPIGSNADPIEVTIKVKAAGN